MATTRQSRINKVSAHFTAKFGKKCWAGYDEQKRKYFVRGENLPAAPEVAHIYPNGWSLLDYLTAKEVDALHGLAIVVCH